MQEKGVEMNDRIIGIIGGMGPEASAKFYMDLVMATKVSKDQEHYRVVIDSNSKIPDRTEAIISNGQNPTNEIVKSAKLLQNSGADPIVMTCITAHNFYEEVAAHLDGIDFIDVLKVLYEYIDTNYNISNVKIGIMSTLGTIKSKVFERYFKRELLLYPDKIHQNKLMSVIYGDTTVVGVKNRNIKSELIAEKELFLDVVENLKEKGVDLIILGCTELPIVFEKIDFASLDINIIDPMQIVIDKLIKSN